MRLAHLQEHVRIFRGWCARITVMRMCGEFLDGPTVETT
jgi:hypothetical protein